MDLKAENFRVINTDFKNASKDIDVDATLVFTSYPDGRFVFKEPDFTKIVYND